MGLIFGRRRRSSRKKSVTSNIPFLKFLGPGSTLAGIVATVFCAMTGRIDLSSLDQIIGSGTGDDTQQIQAIEIHQLGDKSPDTVRVATFNIQHFGDSKSSKPELLAAIAKVISRFDVVAIQEVHGDDAAAIRRLVNLLNASGGRYTATVSVPIGRPNSEGKRGYTEAYAFVWDESRIQITQPAYVVHDPDDRMFREPMVASFQVQTGAADGRVPFRFTLINAHTSPKEVAAGAVGNEMNVLDDVFVSVRQYEYDANREEDFILLGDLNVDTKGLRELGQIPGVVTVAGDMKTNTRLTKTYDHILIDRRMTREYTGRCGVIDLQKEFGISEEEAIQISDHLPLWAEFSAYEMPRFNEVAAGQGSATQR